MTDADRENLLAGERAGLRYRLALPQLAARGVSGLQLGALAGSSLEFKDHRDYQPGDDIRRIDWNAFARSDKLTLKLFREEISPHCDLLFDGSRSMALTGSAKAAATLGVSALLATAAANAGCSVAAWLARSGCEPVINGQLRPSQWEGIAFDYAGTPVEALRRTPPRWRKQGTRVFISDLLWMEEPAALLQLLARDAAAVIVIQLLALQDWRPSERGRLRLVDAETGAQHEINVDDAALNRYQAAVARHQQHWRAACQQSGARFVSLVAEEIVNDWNISALVKQEGILLAH
ncbi:MAG: DUF58 domain-containing protein [Acidobacteria bacterium]|nr:DUF58 domain-containing protein [Acidobacteriota bacterium]